MIDRLYFSPHLDDVALSCGGQVFQAAAAGERVVVVTVFAGDEPAAGLSDFARGLLRGWRLTAGSVMPTRRREDGAACALLGAEPLYWEFLEAPYRVHPQSGRHLYPGPDEMFGPMVPGDAEICVEIEQRLAALPAARSIVAPLAAGGHVDHRIVRRAAEACFGSRLEYFEDFPYARQRRSLERAIRPRDAWRHRAVALSEEALAARAGAIACYRTQVPSLFGSRRRMERRVRRYARRVGGERLWRRAEAGPGRG